jgi:hypothetical protein
MDKLKQIEELVSQYCDYEPPRENEFDVPSKCGNVADKDYYLGQRLVATRIKNILRANSA